MTAIRAKTGASGALVALALPFLLFAQPAAVPGKSTTPQEPAQFNISVDVNLVVLHATVRDRRGHDVLNLRQQDFHLYEDGAAQTISMFRREDTPVTVGLIVDHSGSMEEKLNEVMAAALIFAKSSNPKDQMFVVNFNEKVSFGLGAANRFTDSPPQVEAAISKSRAEGRTALYDAVAEALTTLKQGRWDKKVLVVFSDGGDNASAHTLADITTLAEESSAVIYTIGMFSPSDADADPVILKRLAQATGGEAFFPKEFSEVPDVCAHIAGDIRNQYMIGYVSTGAPETHSFRTVRLEAVAPGQGKLRVRTRTGYIPEEPAK
jgi:VWFA-related protein